MNNALKITRSLLFLIAFLSSTSLVAQQHKQGRQQGQRSLPDTEKIEQMVDKLSTELSLTEAQNEAVLKIYQSHFKQVEELQEQGKPNRDDMEDLRNSLVKDVKEELTAEQEDAYDEYLKEQRSKHQNQRKRHN